MFYIILNSNIFTRTHHPQYPCTTLHHPYFYWATKTIMHTKRNSDLLKFLQLAHIHPSC